MDLLFAVVQTARLRRIPLHIRGAETLAAADRTPAKSMLRMLLHLSTGMASGAHAAFLAHHIDAVTIGSGLHKLRSRLTGLLDLCALAPPILNLQSFTPIMQSPWARHSLAWLLCSTAVLWRKAQCAP